MSSEKVQTVIRRAQSDPQFAKLVLKNPIGTLASYSLTPAEVDQVVTTIKISGVSYPSPPPGSPG